jgi:ubiquinone/menaquinone biosynthesis C-methylase UbiE
VERKLQEGRHSFGGHLDSVLEPLRVLNEIGLTTGNTLLDVGCGEGRFSVPASKIVGVEGRVYALDASEERLALLRGTIAEQSIANIEAFLGDVTERISVDDDSVDVCLMANVFHELVEDGVIKGEMGEIRRVLKPDGVLAIVDFRKDVERPPGPPLSVRLDAREVENVVRQYGFERVRAVEVGPYHYLILVAMGDLAHEGDDHARI